MRESKSCWHQVAQKAAPGWEAEGLKNIFSNIPGNTTSLPEHAAALPRFQSLTEIADIKPSSWEITGSPSTRPLLSSGRQLIFLDKVNMNLTKASNPTDRVSSSLCTICKFTRVDAWFSGERLWRCHPPPLCTVDSTQKLSCQRLTLESQTGSS